MNTIKFSSFKDISDSIIEGMIQTQKEMQEKGLWNDDTTLEEWSHYAGSHICITEQPERLNEPDHIGDAAEMICESLNSENK